MAEWVIRWPTLADLQEQWVAAHCCIPQGFHAGDPLVWTDYQLWCAANFYRVKGSARWQPRKPMLNQAFYSRQGLIVGPQKLGKGPFAASVIAIEAVGPSLFAGWAQGGELFACADWGCGCGFEYVYEPREPMGMPHPTPKIEMMASTEDQVDNTYEPLCTMVRNGPLAERMLIREGFIRLPGDECKISVVTASTRGRLGAPISFALQDESGLFTKSNKLSAVARTQRRGAAGMGGRTLATTNAWDPSANSDAQQVWESQVKDVFKFWDLPPAHLDWSDPAQRREIITYNYRHAPWVVINSILAEAAAIAVVDPAEAERFFGNRAVVGLGAWLEDGLWASAYAGAARG